MKNYFIYHKSSHVTNIKSLGKARSVYWLRLREELPLRDKRLYTQLRKDTTSNNFVVKLHQLKIQHWANF